MRFPSLVLLALLLAFPNAAAATPVKVLGGFFDPSSLDVLTGEEVTWTNEDSMAHTVTSSWDEGASFDIILRSGESHTFTFTDAGTWGVHCRPHSGMEMTIAAKAIDGAAGIAHAQTPGAGFGLVAIALACALLLSRRAR